MGGIHSGSYARVFRVFLVITVDPGSYARVFSVFLVITGAVCNMFHITNTKRRITAIFNFLAVSDTKTRNRSLTLGCVR